MHQHADKVGRRAVVAGLLLGVIALAPGCDSPAPSDATPDPRGKAGQVVGKLSDGRGGPLTNVSIRVTGFTRGNEPVNKVFEVKGSATEYAFDLPDGTYGAPDAWLTVARDARSDEFALAPADGLREWPRSRDAKAGVVRDFAWKIAGPKPDGWGLPLDPTGQWGSAAVFELGGDFGDVARFEVTLTPDGPLIDGSAGRPLTFEKKLPWRRREDHYLLDIPTGRYTATARLLFGTKPKPLKLVSYVVDPANVDQTPDRSALTTTVEFESRRGRDGTLTQTVPTIVVFP